MQIVLSLQSSLRAAHQGIHDLRPAKSVIDPAATARAGSPHRASSDPRTGKLRLTTLVGPGLIVAATGIGSGDVVSATVGGASYGVVLLWAIAIGAFFKFILTEGIARWQ